MNIHRVAESRQAAWISRRTAPMESLFRWFSQSEERHKARTTAKANDNVQRRILPMVRIVARSEVQLSLVAIMGFIQRKSQCSQSVSETKVVASKIVIAGPVRGEFWHWIFGKRNEFFETRHC